MKKIDFFIKYIITSNININKSMSSDRMRAKRLIGELRLLKKDPLEDIDSILEVDKIILNPTTNELTWPFLIKGPDFSDYKGGYYIGQIILGPEYPQKPPDYMMLTPNGRFMTDKKICISNTGFHSNEWSPMWTIKSNLIGFLSIMLDDKEHGISHITTSKEEREKFAQESIQFNILYYKNIFSNFKRFVGVDKEGNLIVPKPNVLAKRNIKQNVEQNVEQSVEQIEEQIEELINENQIQRSVKTVKAVKSVKAVKTVKAVKSVKAVKTAKVAKTAKAVKDTE
jgi:ubiquitin-protein ligase